MSPRTWDVGLLHCYTRVKDNGGASICAVYFHVFFLHFGSCFSNGKDRPEDKLLCYSETSIDGSDVDLKSQSSGDLPSVA